MTATTVHNVAKTSGSTSSSVFARGEDLTGSLTLVDVATISLDPDTGFKELDIICSCRNASFFQVVQDDDGAETVLVDIILSAGQFTLGAILKQIQFTSGSSGVQELILRGKNFILASSLRGTIGIGLT